MDPYRVLFVDPRAPDSVIRAAYRALARAYHPDLNAMPGASRKMAEINDAFATIGGAEERAAYDREHRAGHAAEPQAAAPAPKPPAPSVVVPPPPAAPRNRWNHAAPSSAATEATAVVMDFGRYQGWRLADIARTDREYLRWLRRSSGGNRYRAAIDRLLAGSTS